MGKGIVCVLGEEAGGDVHRLAEAAGLAALTTPPAVAEQADLGEQWDAAELQRRRLHKATAVVAVGGERASPDFWICLEVARAQGVPVLLLYPEGVLPFMLQSPGMVVVRELAQVRRWLSAFSPERKSA